MDRDNFNAHRQHPDGGSLARAARTKGNKNEREEMKELLGFYDPELDLSLAGTAL